jgi:hypothetical protein
MNAVIVPVLLASAFAGGSQNSTNPHLRPTDYDPATEISVKGKIVELKMHQVKGGPAVHVILTTAAGQTYEVHVAPQYFLKWRQFPLAVGDEVEMTISKPHGDEHYLARTVTRGTRKLELRDSRGRPLWTHGTDH